MMETLERDKTYKNKTGSGFLGNAQACSMVKVPVYSHKGDVLGHVYDVALKDSRVLDSEQHQDYLSELIHLLIASSSSTDEGMIFVQLSHTEKCINILKRLSRLTPVLCVGTECFKQYSAEFAELVVTGTKVLVDLEESLDRPIDLSLVDFLRVGLNPYMIEYALSLQESYPLLKLVFNDALNVVQTEKLYSLGFELFQGKLDSL